MTKQGVRLIIVEFEITGAKLHEVFDDRLWESALKEILFKSTSESWKPLVAPSTAEGCGVGAFANGSGSNVLFRGYYNQELLTVDIQEERTEGVPDTFTANVLEKLCSFICSELSSRLLRPAAIIPRGGALNNLFFSSDQRLLVYDFDRVVVDVHSEFQHIQIFHSPQFGNTLILDGYINLAENDLIYTHTFMRKGKENYKGREVLILGGGDGALLKEVLDEEPKFVTMIDIDELVLNICKKHMRTCCGTALDTTDGPHHKIIIADCFPVIDELIASGKKFEFVFSDLTDVPVVTEGETKHAEFWELMTKILDKSVELLAPGGKLLNHLVGICSKDIIEKYETILTGRNLKYEQSVVMVPSFLEPWVFYCIQKN